MLASNEVWTTVLSGAGGAFVAAGSFFIHLSTYFKKNFIGPAQLHSEYYSRDEVDRKMEKLESTTARKFSDFEERYVGDLKGNNSIMKELFKKDLQLFENELKNIHAGVLDIKKDIHQLRNQTILGISNTGPSKNDT